MSDARFRGWDAIINKQAAAHLPRQKEALVAVTCKDAPLRAMNPNMATKTLQAAMNRVETLPEAAQEQIGREILARIEALDALRAELQIGLDELDAGLAEELDIESVIQEARREHADK